MLLLFKGPGVRSTTGATFLPQEKRMRIFLAYLFNTIRRDIWVREDGAWLPGRVPGVWTFWKTRWSCLIHRKF